jgi:hypothetical protein
MSHFLSIGRLLVSAATGILIGLGTYACGDSASISEEPPVTLSSLTVTPPGTLQPAFSPAITGYVATVSTTNTSVVVTASPENSSTTMMIDGKSANAGQGITVQLDPPPSTKNIPVRLTDRSGAQTTYVVTVTRPASSNNDLQNLTVSPGPLDPAFQAGTTKYTIHVDSGTPSIRVTATLQEASSTLTVDGQGTTSGQARTIDLGAPGSSRDITLIVTAPNGTQKIYTVTVIKAALGENNNLRSLTVSPGSLSPSFSASRTSYAVDVGGRVERISITAAPQDQNAGLTINGQETNSGQARSISLGPDGSSTGIQVIVTAQNGSQKPYLITVDRAALSADNNLEALSVSPGTLDPAFSTSNTGYTVEVATGVGEITVAATKSDPNAVVSGDIPNQGQATIQLDGPGTRKTVSIIVTAPNGTSKIYQITVNRALPSSDNNLSSLTVTPGGLSPGFSPNNQDYTVSSSAASLTVSATKSDPNAVMSGSVTAGAGIQTGSATISLGGPEITTRITITVTAPNGDSKIYTITVSRPFR